MGALALIMLRSDATDFGRSNAPTSPTRAYVAHWSSRLRPMLGAARECGTYRRTLTSFAGFCRRFHSLRMAVTILTPYAPPILTLSFVPQMIAIVTVAFSCFFP